nr:hypothetical protein GCM10020063_000520 [Dactylosporangium thailandense]
MLWRLDRVDTVVLDARALTTGRFTVGRLAGLGADLTAEEESDLRARAGALLDPDAPERVVRAGEWQLGPLPEVAPKDGPAGGRAVRAGPDPGRRHARAGTRRSGARDRRRRARAATQRRRPGRVGPRRGQVRGRRVGSGLGERFSPDEVVAGGTHLAGEIRRLQGQDRVVALVTSGGSAAPAAADCAIGVLDGDGPVPWAADLLCGPGLA